MSFGKRGNSPPEQDSLQSHHQSSVNTNTRQLRAIEPEGPDLVLYGAAFVAIVACVVIVLKLASSQLSQLASAQPPGEEAPIVTSDVAPLDTIRQRLTDGENGRTFEFA